LTQVGVTPQNRRYNRNRAGTTVVNLALQATAKYGRISAVGRTAGTAE
jgi:hypothetical protein